MAIATPTLTINATLSTDSTEFNTLSLPIDHTITGVITDIDDNIDITFSYEDTDSKYEYLFIGVTDFANCNESYCIVRDKTFDIQYSDESEDISVWCKKEIEFPERKRVENDTIATLNINVLEDDSNIIIDVMSLLNDTPTSVIVGAVTATLTETKSVGSNGYWEYTATGVDSGKQLVTVTMPNSGTHVIKHMK